MDRQMLSLFRSGLAPRMLDTSAVMRRPPMTAQSQHRAVLAALLAALVPVASLAGSCGGDATAGASSGTTSHQGGQGGGDLFPDGGGGAKAVDSNYPCKGCDPFPPIGTGACD